LIEADRSTIDLVIEVGLGGGGGGAAFDDDDKEETAEICFKASE
jgi:uncharacterized spore protein YtfJ